MCRKIRPPFFAACYTLFALLGLVRNGRRIILTRERGSRTVCKLQKKYALRGGALSYSRNRRVHRRQPVVTIRFFAGDDCEIFILQTLRNRAARTVADGNSVNRTQRSNFHGGAREENF